MSQQVIFEERRPTDKPDEVSQEIYKKYSQFFNKLELEVYNAVWNFHADTDKWPTTFEIADYMDEGHSSVQPRTSELFESQVLVKNKKRKCTCDLETHESHNIRINTWRPLQ